MARIEFEVYSRKHGEHRINVPDKIVEKGDEAIRDYLWRNNAIETALDYGTRDTEINYIITDKD